MTDHANLIELANANSRPKKVLQPYFVKPLLRDMATALATKDAEIARLTAENARLRLPSPPCAALVEALEAYLADCTNEECEFCERARAALARHAKAADRG